MLRTLWSVALVIASAPALAADVIRAEPSGRWVVEFADQHCMASHRFNIGADEFAVSLQPRPATEYSSVWLRVPKSGLRLDSAQVAVGGTPIERKDMSLQGVDKAGRRSYSVQLTGAEFLRLLASGQLRVTASAWASDFALPRLADVQQTLDTCVADLLSRWGMSAQAQAQLASFPKPEKEPIEYVTPNDYPTGALDRMASGAAEVRITVGADGRGKKCHVMRSSGDPELDSTTCAIFVKRARYQAARTKQGEAVEAPYVVTLYWRVH